MFNFSHVAVLRHFSLLAVFLFDFSWLFDLSCFAIHFDFVLAFLDLSMLFGFFWFFAQNLHPMQLFDFRSAHVPTASRKHTISGPYKRNRAVQILEPSCRLH